MGRQRRPQPRLLAKKLRAVRTHLGIGQAEMARRLNHGPSPPDGAMVSRFERGEREPNLFVIVAYARLAKVSTDVLIDDAWSIGDMVKEMPQQ
jgi:transcriptional regulator with XRE-family HTH domain